MGKLFGTNGVRGVVNTDFTIELAAKIAATAGSVLGKKIAVGRDARTSSPMFREAVVSGLLSVGCDVIDFGVLPTPAIQYCLKHLGLDGGLMITASHNPPQFNGIKMFFRDGVEIPRSLEYRIEEIYFTGGPKAKAWNQVGFVEHREVLEIYIDSIINKVDSAKIKEKRFKVAIDPGNGVGALVAPIIAQRLGCEVNTINSDLDGRFPGRESEPRPDNLHCLKTLLKATGSDMGVAFDGDADRSIFLDERGEVLWGDRSFALTAQDFMKKNPGAKVVTPISSSNAIVDVVKKGNGSIHWTRVGSVDVSRAMVENGIMFGGEENGGVMYGLHHPVRDGSMTMALILEIMTEAGRPLSNLVAELPHYSQLKDKVTCPNEKKVKLLEALQGKISAPHVETSDGLKLSFPDKSWILIRPSGTEPIFRIYAEAASQQSVEKLMQINKKIIEDTLKTI